VDPADATELKDLFRVGLSMMFSATGHDSSHPEDAFGEALTPSAVQLAVSKLNVDRTRAKFAEGAPPASPGLTDSELLHDVGTPFGEDNDKVGTQKSFGQLNSPVETFGGFAPAGMVVLCVTSMLLLIAGAVFLGLIIALIKKIFSMDDNQTVNWSPEPARMILGTHGAVRSFMASTMDIPATNHDFEECVVAGVMAFYGLSDNSFPLVGPPSTFLGMVVSVPIAMALGATENILGGAGFYVGIIRQATRDPLNLESIANSVSGMSLLGGLQGIANALREIVRSPTWQFLMTMAQIGNCMLDKKTRRFGTTVPINWINDTPGTKIGKSRIKPINPSDANKIAWRHSSNQSSYLLPASLQSAITQLAGTDKSVSAFDRGVLGGKFASGEQLRGLGKSIEDSDASKKGIKVTNDRGSRFTKDFVKYLENKLESEYVPFYFQDLRTNEIVAFNAFISDLSDSYSVDYSTTNAYGRIDPVVVYRKTARNIGLTFTVAALDREDFDAMWWDINKLTTMLYPQWSKGRPVQTEGGDPKKFIMPFSQIPTASPMIRMRVGDVVRGNYSKFNLARLFGAGVQGHKKGEYNIGSEEDPTWEFEGESGLTSYDAHEKWHKRVDELKKRMAEPEPKDDNLLADLVPIPSFGSEAVKFGYVKDEEAWLKSGQTIRGVDESTLGVVAATVADAIGTSKPPVTQTTTAAGTVKIIDTLGDNVYHVQFVKDNFNQVADAERVWIVTHSQLTYSLRWIRKVGAPQPTMTNLDVDAIAEFYGNDPSKGNAVVRSFESAMGRGLAGFITAFDLDYGESTWEVDLGARAPKTVTITISFQPIHDIPPGLDSDGFNRAPLYNVGKIVNSVAGDQWGDDLSDPENWARKNYEAAAGALTLTKAQKKDFDFGGL